MGAVIDPASYATITQAIEQSRHDSDADVVCGGQYDDAEGYFIAPTIIQAHDPHYTTMEVELFGPALTVFVYDDNKYEETCVLYTSPSPRDS